MRLLLFLAAIPIACVASTPHVVVFGKNDSLSFNDGAPKRVSGDPTRTKLVQALSSDLEHPAPFATTIPLTDFPVYGRNVAGAHGEIRFHASFAGAFVTNVSITGLLPRHSYILTLNGNPERDGNDRLPTPVPGNERERYFDFQTITTDGDGKYEALYAIALPLGHYDLRFYVKDTSDFKIVLYHDFFPFQVE